MHYIVIDLEWNQAMSAKSSVYNKLPIRLRGEIIQIGAVKLDKNFAPTEEFQIDIKPVYFRRIHYKVKKLTGFDSERLSHGVSFPEAIETFREWCGDGCTFITWGCDDKGIFEQNIIIHDLDWDWIADWVNLQHIFNIQTDGDRSQKALSTAMEHFGIEQTRVAHDALGDAYNTGLVCSKLDFIAGLEKYDEALRNLSLQKQKRAGSEEDGPEPLEHLTFGGYASKTDALASEEVSVLCCPECEQVLKNGRWVNQGDNRYMTLASCAEHGKYLVRLKFRRTEDDSWCANRIVYRADEEMDEYYRQKLQQSRRRKRRHKKVSSKAKA